MRNLGLLEALPHELKHAYQFEIGELSLGYAGRGGSLYDLQDEVDAHRRSQMFGYYFGETIDANWVTNRGYTLTQRQQITTSTPANANFTYGDQIKAYIHSKGKVGQSPVEVIKDWQIYYNQGASGKPFKK